MKEPLLRLLLLEHPEEDLTTNLGSLSDSGTEEAQQLPSSCDQRTSRKRKYSPVKVCYRCGRKSHLIRDCYARYDVEGNWIEESCDEEEKDIHNYNMKISRDTFRYFSSDDNDSDNDDSSDSDQSDDSEGEYSGCERCGYLNHDTTHCYARRDIYGRYLKKWWS